jgi:hypothetical protein
MFDDGAGDSLKRVPAEIIRASIARELRYLFASSRNASGGFRMNPAGVAHSVGVCIIEDWNMARGRGKAGESRAGGAMPAFVDVKLSEADRENFLASLGDDLDAVKALQSFADDGYRVGVAWSGEHQTYTVSVTCRDEESENNGLCMTSFAGDLSRGILLAWFKHDVVCKRRWKSFVPPREESFG